MFPDGTAKNRRNPTFLDFIFERFSEAFQCRSDRVRVTVVVVAQEVSNVIGDFGLKHLIRGCLFLFSQRLPDVFGSFAPEISTSRATHTPPYAETLDCNW